MSEYGLFRNADESLYVYWLKTASASVHGQTHMDASQGIINLTSIGVDTDHWRERFGSIALQSLCAGILQAEPTAKTLLAELVTQFHFDIVKGAFEANALKILRSPDARRFRNIDYILASSLEIILNGSDLTEAFMSARYLSDEVFGNGDTFAVVDLSAVDKSDWEVPTIVLD